MRFQDIVEKVHEILAMTFPDIEMQQKEDRAQLRHFPKSEELEFYKRQYFLFELSTHEGLLTAETFVHDVDLNPPYSRLFKEYPLPMDDLDLVDIREISGMFCWLVNELSGKNVVWAFSEELDAAVFDYLLRRLVVISNREKYFELATRLIRSSREHVFDTILLVTQSKNFDTNQLRTIYKNILAAKELE